MNIREAIDLYCSGTTEGALKTWETRDRGSRAGTSEDAPKFGRGKKTFENPKVHFVDRETENLILRMEDVDADAFAQGFTIEHPDYHVEKLRASTIYEDEGPYYEPEEEGDEGYYGDPEVKHVRVTGQVFDNETGKAVGDFEREINLNNRSVYHASFFLDKEAQGKGIAASLSEKQFAMYRELGIDEVHVTANGDIGKYAWALQGFDFKENSGYGITPSSRKAKFRNMLVDKGLLAEDPQYNNNDAKAVEAMVGDLKHSWDYARFEVGGVKIGKEFMLAQDSWSGTMVLDPASMNQAVFRVYLEHTKEKSKIPKAYVDPNQRSFPFIKARLKNPVNASHEGMDDHDSVGFHKETLDNEDSIYRAIKALRMMKR